MATAARRISFVMIPLLFILGMGWLILDQLRSSMFTPEEAFPYGEIRIAVDASYPPFALLKDDSLIGLDIDLGRAIGDALDIPVRFIPIGFDGLYDAVITDKVDMAIAALTINPALMKDIRYTQPYFNNGLLLVSNQNIPLTEMKQLFGHRLAYEFGSSADSEVRKWSRRLSNIEMRPYELPDYALDALQLNQADAALVDATSFYLYENQHPDWQTSQRYITHLPMSIALRIDRVQAWDATNWALKSLWDDGTLQKIIAKWL